jgi:hypothetical protein
MNNTNLPIYKIYIDLNDERTGLEANSGVHDPAHELLTITFNKDSKKFKMSRDEVSKQIDTSFNKTMKFNDENQTVYGVAISANTPIYRNDGTDEYYVEFDSAGISDMIFDYSRKENFNNFNVEHNSNNPEDGVYMIMSYQIDNAKGFTAPEKFENENDGSWILGYKITNKDVYNKFKSGEIRGFSVEGTFIMDEFEFSSESVLKQLDELIDKLKNKQ